MTTDPQGDRPADPRGGGHADPRGGGHAGPQGGVDAADPQGGMQGRESVPRRARRAVADGIQRRRRRSLMDLTERAGQDELLQIRNDLMTVYREIGAGDDRLFPLRYARAGGTPTSLHGRTATVPIAADGSAADVSGDLGSGGTPLETLADADEDLPPILILPDGPGTASVLPYDVLRRMMTQRGLDVLMMEHRGVGLSRLDAEGEDLPAAAMTLDAVLGDILAVLDHAAVPRAVVYGSGYGAYLAQLLAALHPERVHALVLDSPRVASCDDAVARAVFRAHYREGTYDRTESIARVIRRLCAEGVIDGHRAGPVLLAVHDFGGPEAVGELVDLLAQDRGRLTWTSIRQVLTRQWLQSTPYVQEDDLVARILHTEMGVGAPDPDGGDLDPLGLLVQQARTVPPFAGEEHDLRALAPSISAPTVILSGREDLRTPPAIAEGLAELIPDAHLVSLPRTGHGILDTHPSVAIIAAWWAAAGQGDRLPEHADVLARMPRVSIKGAVTEGLRLALVAERFSPWKLWFETARSRRVEADVDPTGRRARRARAL